MAQECLSVCGVVFSRDSDGQLRAAAFGEVVLHHCDGRLGERGGALLSRARELSQPAR